MITRKLGRILRGNATPFQIVAACVLGSLLGFAPPLFQAPALYMLLVAALLLVNANLGVALLVGGVTRLVALLALPVSFGLGRFLLDGPTTVLAETLVNAPVLAWCGLDYYAVAGGELLGLVVGLALGFLLARSIDLFRRRMLAAQGNPSRLSQLASRRWARVLTWVFLGGSGKGTWEEKLARRRTNPIRLWGAAVLLLGLAGLWFAQARLIGPLARRGLTASLESVNGATVDVGGVELDLEDARVTIAGLALTDPNELEVDLFRAELLEADVDQADFLRRRLHVGRLVIREAHGGLRRETPGRRLAPAAPPPPETEDEPDDEYTLEEVLADYELWKERLSQVRAWIDRLSGAADVVIGDGEDEETASERLARRAREQGWLSVRAGHLVDEAPSLLLSELRVDGLDTTYLPGRTFDVVGRNLSSHPGLVEESPRLEVAARDGSLGFVLDLAPASRGGGDGALRFHWRGLPLDDVLAKLELEGGSPFRGGTLDLELDGAWDGGRIGWIDLPLRVTLRDTVLATKGIDPTPIAELAFPIGLSGPIDSLGVRFDASILTGALVAAGKAELAGRLKDALEAELGEVDLGGLEEKLPQGLDGVLPDAKGAIDGLLGGKKKKKD